MKKETREIIDGMRTELDRQLNLGVAYRKEISELTETVKVLKLLGFKQDQDNAILIRQALDLESKNFKLDQENIRLLLKESELKNDIYNLIYREGDTEGLKTREKYKSMKEDIQRKRDLLFGVKDLKEDDSSTETRYIHGAKDDGIKEGELYPDNSIIEFHLKDAIMHLKQHSHYAHGERIPDSEKIRK